VTELRFFQVNRTGVSAVGDTKIQTVLVDIDVSVGKRRD